MLVLVGSGVTSAKQPGASLQLLDPVNGAVLKDYGSFPANPAGYVDGGGWGINFGRQSAFFYVVETTMGQAIDLFFFDADATGLFRSTTYLSGMTAAASTSNRMRSVGLRRNVFNGRSLRKASEVQLAPAR
ncbi:hypothetical protein [Sphaerotilus microaerophilus]|uniref:hypothetical protein n=1 Tax=Sphaerotilus microaerophilus TaxID=2914710 RepID=UPI0020739BE8|nr:hypothetical protein [Sphaerotilus sp. FB-5]